MRVSVGGAVTRKVFRRCVHTGRMDPGNRRRHILRDRLRILAVAPLAHEGMDAVPTVGHRREVDVKAQRLEPCDIELISLCTALGPWGPTWRAPARQGTPVSTKQTVPPSWLVDTRSVWAITPRTDWISCRRRPGRAHSG